MRTQTIGVPWLIVSGGDQDEIKRVFHLRKLEILFDGGIFGSQKQVRDPAHAENTKLVGARLFFLATASMIMRLRSFLI